MHPIHPIVVHFPIALLSVSVLFDILKLRWRDWGFREAALYTLILGLAGGVLAVITGDMAEDIEKARGIPKAVKAVIDTHEAFGYATLWLFAGLLAIRLLTQTKWMREVPALSIGLGLIGIVLLSIAGYYGGSLVYEFGAGFMGSKTVLVP